MGASTIRSVFGLIRSLVAIAALIALGVVYFYFVRTDGTVFAVLVAAIFGLGGLVIGHRIGRRTANPPQPSDNLQE
jgi:hypothetical protein